MASSSNNSYSSALVTLPRKRNHYDVFITFRGDTRNNFTDHLFDALHREGIFAFRDDTNLPKGESIGPELLRAIEESQIYVVVFSRNYASSTWCLQELEKILECVHISKKYVLPVFYDVDPSVVRKQSGIYGEAFVEHELRFQQNSQMVRRWREALTQVADLSGWDIHDKRQSLEIKKIVQRMIKILDCKSSCVSKDLVGIDSPMQELEKLLLLDEVDDVCAVGICGMGGIGKTTLGIVLYDRISHQFGACCFIDDVSKIFRLHDGPLGVQKQILHQTLGEEHHQICNLYNASNLIRRRLCRQRVLMIFDNVDKVEQLEKIGVRREWLGGGSKIIIISRDEHILKEFGVDEVYKVPLLDWTNSQQLLCRKAFKVDHILSSYEGLVNGILHYVNGLPLAIKVFGSFLYGRDISEWRSALSRLRESPYKDVMDVLHLCFDGLEDSEKEIFLHIACFFNKQEMKYVKNILNCCGFHADIGLTVLTNKSLISMEESISMHELLQELGRKIVRENSSKDRRKWSRLWLKKQFNDVMLENMENHVEAIVLSECLYDNENDENMDMIVKDLSQMRHLKLLIFDSVSISGSFSCLSSNELRYVEWDEYPFKYLPSSLQPNQLVELILQKSRIKQLWEGEKYLPNLRNLDLSDSINLIKMPDFREFPNLERLNLEGCTKLVQLDSSIGVLRKLVSLNLKDCESLVSIPNNVFDLNSLKELNMSWCSKVSFKNSRHLNVNESSSHSQSTFSIFKRTMLPYPSLHSLRELDLCNLRRIPNAIGCLNWLEELNLRGNKFVTLPSLRELSKLVYLNLEHCKKLKHLPELSFPTAIEHDHLHKNNFLKTKGLLIFNCPKLGESWSSMTFSWMIQFIRANPQSSPDSFDRVQIVTPGSEIPSCSVFSVELIDPRMGSHGIRRLDSMSLLFSNIYRKESEKSVTYIPVILHGDYITVKSNHIWLIYFPLSSLEVQNDTLRYKIYGYKNYLDIEVKNCGFRWIYKQDLQEFNSGESHKFLSSKAQVFCN